MKWQTRALFTKAVMKSDLPEFGRYFYQARSVLVLIPFLLRLCPPGVGTCTEAELVPLCPRCLSEHWQKFLWICGFIHFSPNKQTWPQSKDPPVYIEAESSHYPKSFSLLFPLSLLAPWGLSFHRESYSENFLCVSLDVCIFFA